MRQWMYVASGIVAGAVVVIAGPLQAPPPAAPPPAAAGAASSAAPPANGQLPPDANGNSRHIAFKTGHVTNYDESKIAPYTLPDPLTLANSRKVTDASTWTRERRAQIISLYETNIYGHVPRNAPSITWSVASTDPAARGGTAVMKRLVGKVGRGPAGPEIPVTMYTPAHTTKPVPMILVLSFGGGPAGGRGSAVADPPVAADILAHGWGFATIGYNDIQPDRADAFTEGVIGQTLAPGQKAPGADEWGTIAAWAWGTSRVIDYLQTDASVDPYQIALQGFSRLGKAVLWASAMDDRVVVLWSACGGEMGSAISRRDWGETVDDMAQNFPWQFSQAFQQWPGHWNDMPVDANMLIALSAPRPVFITGGTGDEWADPKGEFLAEVAAGPVYRLLGRKDLGTTAFPGADAPVISGDLGFLEHTGPHGAPAGDWRVFLDFLGKYFR